MENLKSKLSWSDFKLNSDGMVPVIVQDYKTDQVTGAAAETSCGPKDLPPAMFST